MKTNLKTFPNRDKVDDTDEWAFLVGEWFEAFEKELRKKLTDQDWIQKNNPHSAIKEILGEVDRP